MNPKLEKPVPVLLVYFDHVYSELSFEGFDMFFSELRFSRLKSYQILRSVDWVSFQPRPQIQLEEFPGNC